MSKQKQYNSADKKSPYELVAELEQRVRNIESERESERFSTKDRYIREIVIASNGKFRIEEKDSDPSTCNVGELIVVSGKLKICSATDTWTVVGTQT